MSDAIKRGMYLGENTVERISLDRRMIKVKTENGDYIDVPSPEYVRGLEQQLLAVQKALAIVEEETKRHDGIIKRLTAAIRKVDSKIR